ncbi:MAG: helix-turn-helix transcriptional regulator [Ruminococcaceae bacterium]|nr:helix-turn-helix transcriptional regulator [Oscillospiraceae bacterium]
MEFTKIMAMCLEPQGFHLRRSTTGDDNIFIHFLSPAEVNLKGTWIKVRKGACIFWKANSYQEYIATDTPLLHNYFHIYHAQNKELEEILAKYGLNFETVYYAHDNSAITELMQQIEIELLKQHAYYHDMCRLRLEEILIMLSRNLNDSDVSTVDAETYKRFTALRQQFHMEFNKNWSVNDMAAAVNLSPSRFYSLYKQIFNISPKKDFLNIRIEHAKKLMQQGNYSIREIAEIAGYNNQYHFIRQFREVTGTTPGKFIKNYYHH